MLREDPSMGPDELVTLLDESGPPFTIETKGGRSYRITDRANVWIPEAYKAMVCVAIPAKGIVVLRLSAIEGVHIENDVASAR
jgi:hypothetical protein